MESNFGFEQNKYRQDVNFNNYYWFNNGFTHDELMLIESMTSELEWTDAATGQDDSARLSDYRKSRIKWCPHNQDWKWVYTKLHDMLVEANDVMWKFDLTHMREEIQYTEYYGNNSGGYEWHMDCGIGIQNQRKVSVTVQLSEPEEYVGGNLEFNLGGDVITAPRLQGSAVIFPSFYLHRVTPITSGTRKSFVLWVGGEPYR
jgi:PKHD-type hydroxylase